MPGPTSLSTDQLLLTTLLVKLAVMAAAATVLVRFRWFRHFLIFEQRPSPDRLTFALSLGSLLSVGVMSRLLLGYQAGDLTLEGAFLAGLMLKNGPITLGSQVGLIFSQGAQQLTGIAQRREFEVAIGGNYNIAPGLYLVAEYQYEQRHQGGFDFQAGAVGPTRDAHGQGVTLSTVLNW